MSSKSNVCSCCTSPFVRSQPSKAPGMNSTFIAIFCFLFAMITNMGSAHARILTTLQGTEAHVTNNVFQAEVTQLWCSNGELLEFWYVQRMIIGGKVEMVLTEAIVDVGTYALTILGECNGKTLYGLGTCACLTADFKEKSSFETIGTVAPADKETHAQELSVIAPGKGTAAILPGGSLWIRNAGKKNLLMAS